MKKNTLLMLLAVLLGGAVALPNLVLAQEKKVEQIPQPITVYEITLDKKEKKAAKEIQESVSKSEDFAAGGCKVTKKKLVFACTRADAKTDSMFRKAVEEHGTLKTTVSKNPKPYAALFACPPGCKLAICNTHTIGCCNSAGDPCF